MKDENDLYNPIITGARSAGFHLYRLYDGTLGKKPFDIGGIAPDGRAVGLEVKYYRHKMNTKLHDNGEAVIPWSSFEVQQIAYLKAFARNGGLPIVYIYYALDKVHAAFVLDEQDIGCAIPQEYIRMWEHIAGYNNAQSIMGWHKLLTIRPGYPTPNK